MTKKKPAAAPYVVREALLPKEDGGHLQRWYIYRDFLPVEAVNYFLNRKSANSPKTGKTYAYSLASWLNFLHMRETKYHEACKEDVEAYKDYLAYGMHGNSAVLKLKSHITYATLCGAIQAIQGFYRLLDGHVEVFTPNAKSKTKKKTAGRRKAKHSFMYGQIYETPVEELIDLENMRLKESGFKKHWLTEAEKTAILASLKTVRDKAMFMLLCEGMRIDEVLSIKYSAYDSGELTVKPSRSKGYSDEYEDKFRVIAFHDVRTAEHLDQYIMTERADVEADLDDLLEPLFVNLKRHPKSYGEPVGYRNWWGVLKTAVKNAGIDPDEVSTHVGRRTFVQEKLEEGEDLEMIRQMLGWASLSPLDSYRNMGSKVLIKKAAEKARRPGGSTVENSNGKDD